MAKNPYLKSANEVTEFTAEQVMDLKKCADDPVYFAEKFCHIQHPVKGSVPVELYPYQKRMLASFKGNRNVVVLSARQTGKALCTSTRIPTPTGWTTMGEINVGDFVLGSDGTPVQVIGATDVMYNHSCYEVCFSNNESIVADADHQWEVNDTFIGRSVIKTTYEMLTAGGGPRPDGKTCRYSVNVAAPLELPDQPLPIDPYVFGTWLGDGTSSKGEWTVHKDDIEIYQNHPAFDEYTSRIIKHAPNCLQFRYKALDERLDELCVKNHKHIPIIYLRSSTSQRIALLQGLMDTDGTVDKTRGGCELTLSNNQLAADAYELICSLGLKPTMHKRIKGGFETNSIIFTPYRDDFDVFKLTRKVKKQKQSPHPSRASSTKRRSILSINPVDTVPVRCITVAAPDQLFLVGPAMIPTHNSTISCIYLLWFAIFHFEKTVLIASNKNENAMEMIHRIKFMYERLPQWLKPGIESDGYNKHALGFDNGSRIHSTATSETSGRGMSISLLFCDEFAFVRDSTAEEFWTSIAPTLATGGSCIIASTPNGDSNLFAQLWRGAQAGVNGFFPIEVKWNEPPGRDEKFKKEEMGKLGKIRWLQEYECEMLSTDPLLFDSLMLTNLTAVTDKITPIGTAGDIVFYEQPQPGATYLVGVDPATGSGNDFATIQVFSFPAMEQVAEWRSNTVSSVILYHTLKKILLLLEKNESTVYFSVENNGVGEALIALYTADEHPPSADFVSEDGQKRQGMTTTGRSKIQACLSFKDMIERGAMTIRSSNLLKEMKNYARKAGSYAAKRGATDDLIAACLIVVRLVTEISSYDDDAYNKLYAGAHHVEAEDIDYDDSDYGVDFVM